MTRLQIADDLGISAVTVGNLLKEASFKTRSKDTGSGKPGQLRTSSNGEKELVSASPLMVEMAAVIAEYAAKLGKGELIISAYPDGSCSIIWELEAANEKT